MRRFNRNWPARRRRRDESAMATACERVHTARMRRTRSSPCLALAVAAGSLFLWQLPAHAQGASDRSIPASAESIAACERAAAQALAAEAVPTAGVMFDAAPTVQLNLSSDSQTVLRGVARLRGTGRVRSFNYSCNIDPRTSRAVGVVIRASTSVDAASTRAQSEPDLGHLSPGACQSSAVEALKQRWPRVSQVTFDSATRRFMQASVGKAELHGRGRALPAPGSPSTHFGFDCEIDPRDGRVLGMRVSG